MNLPRHYTIYTYYVSTLHKFCVLCTNITQFKRIMYQPYTNSAYYVLTLHNLNGLCINLTQI